MLILYELKAEQLDTPRKDGRKIGLKYHTGASNLHFPFHTAEFSLLLA